jgi:hypothetical protein
MAQACGNCGSTQGPFDKTRIGVNKKNLDPLVVTCAHGPLNEAGHGTGTLACLARRAAQDIKRWGHELPTPIHITQSRAVGS